MEGNPMTDRAELEADIENLEGLRDSLLLCGQIEPVERISLDCAIARLRRDLAKIDGPTEGTFRVFVSIEGKQSGRTTCAAECDSYVYDSAESAQEQADPWTQAIVFVDLPIRTVPVIEGEVCDGQ